MTIPTSPATKAKIVTLLEYTDQSYAEVARDVGRDPTTVSQIYKQYHKTHEFGAVPIQTGRPRKLTQKDGRFTVLSLHHGAGPNAAELQQTLFPDVSVKTVQQRLKEEGLNNYACHKVPLLKPGHIKVWQEWAEALLGWTLENWSAVAYSDVSQFKVFGNDGRLCCWRRPGEALDPQYTKKQVPHGGGSVMVWGVITRYGVGWLCRISGKLTSAGYVKILQEDLLGSLRDLNINPEDIYFQWDKDIKQWTRIVAEFLENLS